MTLPGTQRISFFKPKPENRCVYCNSTSYGCRISPTCGLRPGLLPSADRMQFT
jgi:hypothetical protein